MDRGKILRKIFPLYFFAGWIVSDWHILFLVCMKLLMIWGWIIPAIIVAGVIESRQERIRQKGKGK